MLRLRTALMVCALVMSGPLLVAVSPTSETGALPPASTTFTVGTLRVQQYGVHGRPLILLPGLSCGTWEWRGTIAHYMKDHIIYAVTLAGFNGVAAPSQKTGLMDQADASLLKLIRSRHIGKPVLIGHSLGGTLAIRFAEEHAELLSGIVAVDGLPVFPLPGANLRKASAQQMRSRIGHASSSGFAAQQLAYMTRIGVVSPKAAKRYAALSARSDPDSVYEYAAEDMDSDLRPGLKRISAPLLEISPYYKPDYERYASFSNQPLTTAEEKSAYYRRLLSGAPRVKVVTITAARHFVMLDQPHAFYSALEAFLSQWPESD